MNGQPERATRPELAILSVITLAGAYLRFDRLAQPSMWLDEILSYDIATAAARQPWWHWLTAAFEPEHGPLFHALLLLGRVVHTPEFSVRVLAAICGTIVIPVVCMAARTSAGPAAAIAAAALVCISPLNVYYSRDGRPYALLMLLSASILAEALGRARFAVIATLLVACAYTSATAAPLLIAFAICCTVATILSRDAGDRRVWIRTALAAVGSVCVMALLYRSHTPDVSITVTPRLDLHAVLQSFSVSALQPSESRIGFLVLALAIIGAAASAWRDARRATLLIAMTLLPASGAWLAVVWFHHTFEVRYICPALPPYLILAGIGAGEVGRWIIHTAREGRLRRAAEIVIACAIVAPVVAAAAPAARSEPFHKLNWRLIAQAIWQHAGRDDIVIAANDWSAVSLGFYLRQLPPRVRMTNARERTSTIDRLVKAAPPVWIVSASLYRTAVLPGWLCRYPLLIGSPIESFGLHYAPSRSHFLRFRASTAERRALTAPFARSPFSLTFGADDETFLGDGWAGREGIAGDDVRWATGTDANVFLPFNPERSHRIRMRIMPFEARGLPPQRMSVHAGDALLTEVVLRSGWSEYEVSVPAHASPLIRFHFSRASMPAAFDASSSDHRQLAALFTEISVDTPVAVPVGPFAFSVALQDVESLSASDVRKTQFAPSSYRREALTALSGRCGFDPDRAVPRLIAGTLQIEDLAESILDRSGCLDDTDFVRNAYWSIIGRSVTEEDGKRIVKPWTVPAARRRLVQGLIESSEFHDRMTNP